jgi:hypothetical protein
MVSAAHLRFIRGTGRPARGAVGHGLGTGDVRFRRDDDPGREDAQLLDLGGRGSWARSSARGEGEGG